MMMKIARSDYNIIKNGETKMLTKTGKYNLTIISKIKEKNMKEVESGLKIIQRRFGLGEGI
jgi:hypothetical protein